MVHIAAVGVGQFELFQKELNEIAGDNVYDAHNFDELPSLFQDILRESCSKYQSLSCFNERLLEIVCTFHKECV